MVKVLNFTMILDKAMTIYVLMQCSLNQKYAISFEICVSIYCLFLRDQIDQTNCSKNQQWSLINHNACSWLAKPKTLKALDILELFTKNDLVHCTHFVCDILQNREPP